MELIDFGIIIGINGVLCAIFSGLFTVLYRYFFELRRDARLTDLEQEIDSILETIESIRMKGYSSKGVEARREKEERWQSLAVEAITAFKAGKPPEEILKEVGPKYPDLALELAKKGL